MGNAKDRTDAASSDCTPSRGRLWDRWKVSLGSASTSTRRHHCLVIGSPNARGEDSISLWLRKPPNRRLQPRRGTRGSPGVVLRVGRWLPPRIWSEPTSTAAHARAGCWIHDSSRRASVGMVRGRGIGRGSRGGLGPCRWAARGGEIRRTAVPPPRQREPALEHGEASAGVFRPDAPAHHPAAHRRDYHGGGAPHAAAGRAAPGAARSRGGALGSGESTTSAPDPAVREPVSV